MTEVENQRQTIRRCNIAGFGLMLLLFGGFGGWAATAEMAGAVIAPGTIVVESSVKKVQHPTGGVVDQILVKEGDVVKAGQVLIRLNPTLTKASRGIVTSQREELSARLARLIAETSGAAKITFSDDLIKRKTEPLVATAIKGETNLFNARRAALNHQEDQLRQRISQTEEEIKGLSAQVAANDEQLSYITKELDGLADLFKRKLVTTVRYNQLRRSKAELSGQRGSLVASIARARGRISEYKIQIMQLQQTFKSDALKELREVQGKLSETKEKVVAADDKYDRLNIRAPQDGVVKDLAVRTVGGVVGPGDTVMQIVPQDDNVVVDAKVQPRDIDQVNLDAKVHVRILAGNQRTNRDLEGVLIRKGADLEHDQKGENGYYLVRIKLAHVRARKAGDLTLVPGMPAETFIKTQERTPLQYLMKPLVDQFSRAFRER
ncbi:MAG TPA: HlyD family type I secretion periplasmic adaptor subunit [Pseudolabrys sp.]|nr:HlyD family type I secretion periplasmic adaptor subunit [Pseudolabrys sp.]